MDATQEKLLNKLKDFYSGKYTNPLEFETKFNDACKDLVETGDIDSKSYIKFCMDNKIKPIVSARKKSDGCGRGGYRTSSC